MSQQDQFRGTGDVPSEPPKIDNRSYEDLVRQTEALAEAFTAGAVAPKAAQLTGRTLAADVTLPGGEVIAPAGAFVDAVLAERIAGVAELGPVAIRGWQRRDAVISVPAESRWLLGRTLAQTIVHPGTGAILAGEGAVVDARLAAVLAAIANLGRVNVRAGADAGAALIRIFARMAELAVNRVNQIPERNFLAFLNMLGTRVLPPQPARVPLTFTLSAGSPVDSLVPAGAQVASPPPEGQREGIIFETERSLVVTRSDLRAVFVRDPSADFYGDYTVRATGRQDAPFPAFRGDRPIEHDLFLACDPLLTLDGSRRVEFSAKSAHPDRLAGLPLDWRYWNGQEWTPLTISSAALPSGRWRVTISSLPALVQTTVAGERAAWLRARLLVPPTATDPPTIDEISVGVTITNKELAPETGFASALPLDLHKDYYPFGERPRFNDVFYLAGREVFSKGGAVVTANVTLVNPNPDQREPDPAAVRRDPMPVLASKDLVLAWEVFDGSRWVEIGRSGPGLQVPDPKVEDKTRAFTDDGTVTFTLPDKTAPTSVNGVDGHWLRVRIAAGNYGVDATYEVLRDDRGNPKLDANGNPMYLLRSATFAPPVIHSLNFDYTYTATRPLPDCKSYNDFVYRDCGAASGPFQPFVRMADTEPALYLGFSRQLANRPMTLYVRVEPQLYGQAPAGSPPAAPRVVWEYASSAEGGWSPLFAQDETLAFAERGLVTFIGPADAVIRSQFGHELWWLRARWSGGGFTLHPQLRRVMTNTTWASQGVTLVDELLGSSDGSPDQFYRTARTPVLEGQQIEVREAPMAVESVLVAAGGAPGAVTARAPGAWVAWREVADFYGSGPRDRHYSLDRQIGEIRFGDGQHGMIPAQGPSNVRAARYRTGGGVVGNLPAGAVTQLKSTWPYIEGVTNQEPAAGGADAESLAAVKARGPRSLRHRGRAVSREDFEDLAFEASPDVVRARAVGAQAAVERSVADQPAIKDAGRVVLIVAPRSPEAQPIPSLELLNRVGDYVRARCDPAVDLQVVGPDWREVSVTTAVVPVSLDQAEAVQAAVQVALVAFLHPVTGGLDRRGWAFGRQPHRSDLYALIEAVKGVDFVRSLEVTVRDHGVVRPDRFLVFSTDHRVTLSAAGEEV